MVTNTKKIAFKIVFFFIAVNVFASDSRRSSLLSLPPLRLPSQKELPTQKEENRSQPSTPSSGRSNFHPLNYLRTWFLEATTSQQETGNINPEVTSSPSSTPRKKKLSSPPEQKKGRQLTKVFSSMFSKFTPPEPTQAHPCNSLPQEAPLIAQPPIIIEYNAKTPLTFTAPQLLDEALHDLAKTSEAKNELKFFIQSLSLHEKCKKGYSGIFQLNQFLATCSSSGAITVYNGISPVKSGIEKDVYYSISLVPNRPTGWEVLKTIVTVTNTERDDLQYKKELLEGLEREAKWLNFLWRTKDEDKHQARKYFARPLMGELYPPSHLDQKILPIQTGTKETQKGFIYPRLSEKPKKPDTLQLLKEMGRALCYLHSQKITHGDIKGDNVLLNQTEGGIYNLIDFGTLRFWNEQGSLPTFGENAYQGKGPTFGKDAYLEVSTAYNDPPEVNLWKARDIPDGHIAKIEMDIKAIEAIIEILEKKMESIPKDNLDSVDELNPNSKNPIIKTILDHLKNNKVRLAKEELLRNFQSDQLDDLSKYQLLQEIIKEYYKLKGEGKRAISNLRILKRDIGKKYFEVEAEFKLKFDILPTSPTSQTDLALRQAESQDLFNLAMILITSLGGGQNPYSLLISREGLNRNHLVQVPEFMGGILGVTYDPKTNTPTINFDFEQVKVLFSKYVLIAFEGVSDYTYIHQVVEKMLHPQIQERMTSKEFCIWLEENFPEKND